MTKHNTHETIDVDAVASIETPVIQNGEDYLAHHYGADAVVRTIGATVVVLRPRYGVDTIADPVARELANARLLDRFASFVASKIKKMKPEEVTSAFLQTEWAKYSVDARSSSTLRDKVSREAALLNLARLGKSADGIDDDALIAYGYKVLASPDRVAIVESAVRKVLATPDTAAKVEKQSLADTEV